MGTSRIKEQAAESVDLSAEELEKISGGVGLYRAGGSLSRRSLSSSSLSQLGALDRFDPTESGNDKEWKVIIIIENNFDSAVVDRASSLLSRRGQLR